MPRSKRTTVKSERHSELARRSIDGRQRDPVTKRWLPRTPVTGDPPPPVPPVAEPESTPDPTPARRRDPVTFRRRA